MKTLLEEARIQHWRPRYRREPYPTEEVEAAIACFKDEISATQLSSALGRKNEDGKRVHLENWLYPRIKQAYQQGLLK